MLMRSVIPSHNNMVKVTINVNAFNGVRTFRSYSQLSWIMHFLQNLLSRSVVILTLLPISTLQILINMMFTITRNGLPICNQRHISKHISSKSKSTRRTSQGSSNSGLHGVHRSSQCIIYYVSSLSDILWRIGMH